jgi:hypothetical protein
MQGTHLSDVDARSEIRLSANVGVVHRAQDLTQVRCRCGQYLRSELHRKIELTSTSINSRARVDRKEGRKPYPFPPAPPIVMTPTVFSGFELILAEKRTEIASDWASNPGDERRCRQARPDETSDRLLLLGVALGVALLKGKGKVGRTTDG